MSMKTGVVWGFGAAQLLGSSIAFAVSDWSSNEWVVMAGQAVVISQFNLAGVWVALGPQISPWRLALVGMCLTGVTWLPGARFYILRFFVFTFAPGVLATLVLILVARAFGFNIYQGDRLPRTDGARRFQFTVRSILQWTAVTAILLSLTSLVHPEISEIQEQLSRTDVLFLLLPFTLLLATTCVTEAVIILAMRRPWFGLVPLLVAVVTISALIGPSRAQTFAYAWMVACFVLWHAASFTFLRLLGYRFGRSHAIATEGATRGVPQDCPFQEQPDLAD